MQYHIDDYVIGDPEIKPASNLQRDPGGALPASCDVLIVGCGPAGLTLAAQLSQFPDIHTCIIDQKSGPLERGQADGVACRTMEMFNAFGFAHKVLREAYWVNETTFWRTSENAGKGIYRSGRVQDTEDDLSEFPHVILNQARVHQFYLDVMRNSPTRNTPYYNRTICSVAVNGDQSHPVVATLNVNDGTSTSTETIRARYVVGCDGARSTVRSALNLELKGDSASQAWGVMDVLAVTDFPDIRMKSIINAAGGGSIVLIPREGGYLFRVYVEMDKLNDGERVRSRAFTAQHIIDTANKVFHPYTLEVKQVAWWSVYEIGQRLTDRYDNLMDDQRGISTPRIFIAGDAAHTHSPKAGQGMNVSMQDTFNLGWKLAAVLQGRSPASLLNTYNDERHTIAKELIEFDREWADLLHNAARNDGTVTAEEVQTYFVKSGRYTAGTATHYSPSVLTADSQNQHLATGMVIGKRFHSAEVIRLADAKPVQLGHVIEADGRWRLFLFTPCCETPADSINKLSELCRFLELDPTSPVIKYTPSGQHLDSVLDVRAILPHYFRDIDQTQISIPEFLTPRKGQYALRDYEKVFCFASNNEENIYTKRNIGKELGCIVLVRPDQYVSQIFPFDNPEAITDYLKSVLLEI